MVFLYPPVYTTLEKTVYTDSAQTLSSKVLDSTTTTFQDTGTPGSGNLKMNVSTSTTNSNLVFASSFAGGTSYHFPVVAANSANIVMEAVAQTLLNKNLSDTTSFVTNAGTPSKRLGFDLSGNSASTTLTLATAQTTSQTLNVPNLTGTDTVVALAATQTLTNKAFSDTTTTVVNAADSTKVIKFDASGGTASKTLTLASIVTNNRTITFPDATDTVVELTQSQALTNKTLTAPSISSPAFTTSVINTSQPAFSAYLLTTVANVTGNGAAYTIIFDTESFDQGSNFNSGTGIFTAPTTGMYLFRWNVVFLTTALATFSQVKLTTTANDFIVSQDTVIPSTTITQSGSMLAPMTSGNTAKIVITGTGSAGDTWTVYGNSTYAKSTSFSGSLIC